MKLSAVIPVHSEEDCIVETVQGLLEVLGRERIPYGVISRHFNLTVEMPLKAITRGLRAHSLNP